MTQPLVDVGNVTCRVTGLLPGQAEALDAATSYLTEQAHAQQSGWKPPEFGVSGGGYVWDGVVHLGDRTDDGFMFPTGLLPRVQEVLSRFGPWGLRDWRVRPEPDIPPCGELPLRDYQRTAARLAYEAGQGVLEMPPRAGKTRTMLEIHRSIALPTLWMAPTTNIVEQTLRVANEFFPKRHAVAVVGRQALEHLHTPLVICTASTALNLPDEFFASRKVVAWDESHHSASQGWRRINAKTAHIYWRFGMTGTNFRSGSDDLAMHSVLSKVIFRISAGDLVRAGYLVPADVVFIPVEGPRVAGSTKTFHEGVGGKGIFRHDYRNTLAARAAALLQQRGRRPLVLVGTKEQGRFIQTLLREYIPGGLPGSWQHVEFVSTDRPPHVCREVIDAFVAGHVSVLIGTSMIGEGTDLPSADALVYAPGGKAEVGHQQATYRVCTAVPGKTRALIVDFADRHNPTLLRHALERAATYYGQETFVVTALDDAQQFPAWLEQRVAL